MKYLFIVLMLFAVPAYPFDMVTTIAVEGKLKSQLVSRQINVFDDGRNLNQYGYAVNSPTGYTEINHNFVGSPMKSVLDVTLLPEEGNYSNFSERVIYRAEQPPDMEEHSTREVYLKVNYADIHSDVDFATGDRNFMAAGEGKFKARGVSVHIDPILCEVSFFKLQGRGLFNYSEQDDVIPDPSDEDTVPAPTFKSSFCPWIDQSGGASSGFG